ncbi:MAG: hypothetical protein ABI557_14350, partial [Aureliella sp.]
GGGRRDGEGGGGSDYGSTGGSSGYGGMGGGMGGSSGYGGMMGGSMGGDMMGGAGGMMGVGGELDPWELDIEVYGVVTLFNPVAIERLGVEKVTEETQLEVTVEPTEENSLPPPDVINRSPEAPVPGEIGAGEVGVDSAAGTIADGLPANAERGPAPASGLPRGPEEGDSAGVPNTAAGDGTVPNIAVPRPALPPNQ